MPVVRAQFQRALEVLQEVSPSVVPPPMWMRCARSTSRHGPHHGGAAILDNALNIFNNNGALCRLRARIHVRGEGIRASPKTAGKSPVDSNARTTPHGSN